MNTLLNLAEEHIPKSSTSTKFGRPWFNKECKKAVRLWKATTRKFKNLQKQLSQSLKNHQRLQKKYMEKLCCQNK